MSAAAYQDMQAPTRNLQPFSTIQQDVPKKDLHEPDARPSGPTRTSPKALLHRSTNPRITACIRRLSTRQRKNQLAVEKLQKESQAVDQHFREVHEMQRQHIMSLAAKPADVQEEMTASWWLNMFHE